MGFGPPGAIGAKLAAPDRVVISLVGDGGFGQNPSMLATAVELNLGIIWLVMNLKVWVALTWDLHPMVTYFLLWVHARQ